jgi:Transglutaminase-like superfamily/TgpA N-terminal domain
VAEVRHVPLLTSVLATAFTSAAAAWVLAGVFGDAVLAHAVALAGVVLGSGLILLSYRLRPPAVIQFLLVPLALAAGAALAAPAARSGASVPDLVAEAIRQGGLLQPPISFDPGWRFLLIALCVLVSGGSAALALSTERVKLAVLAPLPLAFAAALIQPPGSEVASVAVGVVLGVIGLTLAEGAHLSKAGVTGAAFELRRVGRAGVMAVGLALVLVLFSTAGFLYPQPNRDHVIPPQKPPTPPPVADAVLFRDSGLQGNVLRMGVIDTYDQKQHAWLLPPYDPATLKHYDDPGTIGTPPPKGTPTYTTTVTVANLPGHYLPVPAGAFQISGLHAAADVDPRTGTLKLSTERAAPGMTYTVTAPVLPSGAGLAKAPVPPASLRPYLDAPPMPAAVTDVLATYRQNLVKNGGADTAYDRLQFLRTYLLSHVVAAGEGVPQDITAQDVVAELNGGDATPYEITASEALLARWAGVPARIGYGYYGGDPASGGTLAVHPRHAAMWLEAYFSGYGWVPLTGVPPHAQLSTDTKPKNTNPLIHPSGRLSLLVYVPQDLPEYTALYQYAQYYAVRVLPVVVVLLLALVAFPWPVKLLRRQRRRRWALAGGPGARVAFAYAEWRDLANDLGVGDPGATPVGFLDHFEPDPALEELAWLATRALWGDLRRDLRASDARAAEQLAGALSSRLRLSQPFTNRVLAALSRASLRTPYTTAVPNLWWAAREDAGRPGWRERLRTWRRARRLHRRLASSGAALTLLLVFAACGSSSAMASPPRQLPRLVAPDALGALTLKREPAAEKLFTASTTTMVSGGRVYSIHHDVLVEGSFQLSALKAKYTTDDLVESRTQYCAANQDDCPGHAIVRSIQDNLSAGTGQRLYWHGERFYFFQLPGQRLYLWFPPHSETMAVLVLRDELGVAGALDVAHALIDYQNGRQFAAPHTPSVEDEIAEDATPGSPNQEPST